MGAPDISIATDLASRAAMRRDMADEQYEARVREIAAIRQAAMFNAIVAGDKVAMREFGNSLLELFTHSPILENLGRTGLSQCRDVSGGELQRILLEVLQADALHHAEEELNRKPALPKPLGDSARAAIDAATRALDQLRA